MPTGIPNKKYTGEFKHHAIETMRAEKLSYKETMRQFEVGNHHAIQRWERIYLMGGGRFMLQCSRDPLEIFDFASG